MTSELVFLRYSFVSLPKQGLTKKVFFEIICFTTKFIDLNSSQL